ncbi:MAG: hypothetical protein PHR43_01415 [Dehalococcoidales bacterium]|nr:hypothetical protein [Dehalococcoidales bacterium]
MNSKINTTAKPALRVKSGMNPAIKAPKAAAGTPDRMTVTISEVEHIRRSAQRELELARRIRLEAEKYQQETETHARSQAQLLILQARLETQKEIAALKQKASEEIQKVLADIRMVRITAQEELETQRKFTNAARIHALSLEFSDMHSHAESKKEAVAT